MKKLVVNEDWNFEEIEDDSDLFVVLLKHGSFDSGYTEAYSTDDIAMRAAFDSLVNQYADVGCDELTHIYLIKVPNTKQVNTMLAPTLYNGNTSDPTMLSLLSDVYGRADCEHIDHWAGAGLCEEKKKKKPYSSAYCGFTDPALNIKHFNKCMGTGGLQNPEAPHLIVGDVLPNGPVADTGSSDGASDASGSAGEGGAVGESLKEDTTKEIQIQGNDDIIEDEKELEPPIGLDYFPNNMGINLCSVKKEKWVQQDDGQLKTITIEFDPATEEEKAEQGESIDEAILKLYEYDGPVYLGGRKIIDRWQEQTKAVSAKKALNNIRYKAGEAIGDKGAELVPECLSEMEDEYQQAAANKIEKQPKKCKECGATLMDNGDCPNCDHGDSSALEESKVKNLNEASYSEQVVKMKQLEAGTRGFNAKAASDEKLQLNRQVCIDYNLPKALKIVEDEMIARGLLQSSQRYNPKRTVKLSDYVLDPKMFILGSAKIIWANKDNPQQLIDDYGRDLTDLLIILAFALAMKEAKLADAIKDHIISKFTVTTNELRDFMHKLFTDRAIVMEIKRVVFECCNESLNEDVKLDEAKRYVKRYYVRPLNIFCGNKEDIIQALIRAGDQNCSVYSLKRLKDHEDVHLLQPSDIIYYWDEHVLYDKNHVQVMDYDLFVKHEEERRKVGNVDAISDATFGDIYDDRATEDDLKDKDVIANYKALNSITR